MPPRILSSNITFDDHEDEILFTRAALGADHDAEDLLPATDGWLPSVDVARLADRDVRAKVVTADARRVVANARLDASCVDFGDDLLRDCGRDRRSTRFLQFFSVSVSRFVRQPLADQVAAVRGWLAGSQDATVVKYRERLTNDVAAADTAIVQTRGLATTRGENWLRREALAEDLTRQRDGLYEQLSARARERRLGRDWAATFFRLTPRSTGAAGAGGADAGGGGTEGTGNP